METKNEVWVLVYKFKSIKDKKWLICTKLFKTSNSMFEENNKLAVIFGKKNYKFVHYGFGEV